MNIQKLLIILAISLILPNLAFADNNNSINTYHFNNASKKLDVQLIPNMNSIREMFSAGKYAWASDNTAIAFYDGKAWSSPQTIPGMSVIIFLRPAYPIRGEQAYAWAEGVEGSNVVISYFNGTSWSTAIPVTEQRNKFRFLAAAGRVWIIYQNDAGIHIQHSDTTHPLDFTSLPTLANNEFLHATLDYDGSSDLYFTSLSETKEFSVKRIKFDDSSSVLYKDYGTSEGQVFIKNNRLLLLGGENNPSYFSLDKGLTWKPIQKVLSFPLMLFGFEKDGVACGLAFIPNSSNRPNYCVNLSDATPIWNLASSNPYYFSDGFTDNNGMWRVTPEINQVTYWDSHTNQTSDTHINTIAMKIFHSDYSNSSKSVGNNQVITFGTNKQNEPSVFYYNDKKWISYPLTGKIEKEVCQAYDISQENTWIFSHNRCNPDSDNDYQMYSGDWY